jgi:asparagine synthase (glutamine-hydrolysing)
MRGGFVACLGGEPHLVERAAERLRWHRGAPATHRAGRLTIACLSDPQQGPFVETRGGAARLVHGASPAPLAELRRTATRYAALEWDGTTLKAGRDALGLAPLFYRRLPNALWLATEVGPLAALETPRADLEALSAQAGFVPFAGRTGWCDIYRVGPGEELAVAARDLRVETSGRWDPADVFGRFRGSHGEALAEFRDRLACATADCFEPGTGILLSGGLDSGAVAVTAAAQGLGQPHLVHVHFPIAPQTDERRFAAAVAERIAAPLHLVVGCVSAWDVDAELDLLSIPYNRFPYGIEDAALTHLAAAGVGVALDGHDGDGVLGPPGVEWGELLVKRDFTRFATLGRAYGARRALRGCASAFIPAEMRPPRWRRATYMQGVAPYFTGALRDQILHDDIFRWRWPSKAWLARQMRPLSPRATVQLECKELEAARHGIDLRHPFADRALVEFMISLPCAIKSDPGRTKAFLRDALADGIPALLDQRPKSDYRAIVRQRVDTLHCVERIRVSGVRLPGIDYARLFADAERRPELFPLFLVVNLTRVHAFAQRAA